MVNDIAEELKRAKAKVAELEAAAKKQEEALFGLPAEYGFNNVDDFIAALKEAAGGRRGSAPKKAAAKAGRKGKRARITPEIKNQVKLLVGQEKSGAEIAKELGISLPSVQNIKKEFGLVKSRK